jgi:iron complex outermembrane recepter protein
MPPKHLALGASLITIAFVIASAAEAQQNLPTIDIGGQRLRNGRTARPASAPTAHGPNAPVEAGVTVGATGGQGSGDATQTALFTPGGGSLVAPSIPAVRAELKRNVGSVAFVDANTPEQQTRYIADLRDALKDTPGVYAESRYGQELRLSIRGSNLTRDYHMRGLELLQDGIPMTFADGSGDAYSTDPHYYRAIEVYKGGNGLAYGSSTLGGAINFISPTAYTAISPNYLNVEGGSFDTIRGQAQASRIIGNFDVLLNGSYTHSQGYRGHEQSNYLQLNGNAGYRFSKNLETRFYFGMYDTGQQLPGTLNLYQTMTAPWTSVAPFIASPYQGGFSGNQGRYQQNYRIANKTSLDLGFGQLDVNSWFVGQYLYHPIFVVLQQNTDNWGVTPRFTSTHQIAGHKNEVIAGARFWGESGTDKWFTNYNGMMVNPFGPSDFPALPFVNNFLATAFPPALGAPGGGATWFAPGSWNGLSQLGFVNTCKGLTFGPGGSFPYFNCPGYVNVGQSPQLRNNVFGAFNAEAYFEDRFHLTSEVTAMVGLKYISDRRSSAALGGIAFEPIPGSAALTYHGVMPKFGVMYEPMKDVQIFADGTMSRDVPDILDLTQSIFPPRPPWIANPNGTYGYQMNPLQAQKAWTGEIGSRGKWDRFSWDITYYYSRLWDELLKFNVDPGTGIYSTTFNAPNTVHQGVEVGGGVEVLRDIVAPDAGDVLKISQIWNMNNFYFSGDSIYGNNWLPAIPRNVLRTTVSYTTKDGFYLAPQVDWVPLGAYVDYANTLQAPGYALIGMQAGLKMPNGIEWYVDARNLGNVHYVSDVISVANAQKPLGAYPVGIPQSFYPGNGPAIYSGVKYRF